jgi:excinuclease ABC subunit A
MAKELELKTDSIFIKGARMHNLKNVDVAIPRNQLVVVTGLSGSGKSSLAFDTLYAEGQRRYVESLSSYARQFLGKIDKPSVDNIEGIAPAIAIEQKVSSRSSRSTVGTSTEIYDYLKLLFARVGKTHSPVSGKVVGSEGVEEVIDFAAKLEKDTKLVVSAPIVLQENQEWAKRIETLKNQGYSRAWWEGSISELDELAPETDEVLHLVIDRLVVDPNNDEFISRLGDSAELALYEGHGECRLTVMGDSLEHRDFNDRFELDGISFERPSVNFFSFNNPYGACKTCEGFGSVIGIDRDLVIPNKNLSVFEDAIVCWKGEKMSKWRDELIANAMEFDFPIHRPYFELSPEQKEVLWTGNQYFEGLDDFFKYLQSKSHKIQYRVMLSRYRGKTICPDCQGTRLRKDASYVKIDGRSIVDLVQMSIGELLQTINAFQLAAYESKLSTRILTEIRNRLECLEDVGLGYLSMNRLSASLSGGETQRINLATSIGSSLVGSMYILDEPSVGLHSRDTQRLIKVLSRLKELGNTVIVVEHDDEIIRAADYLIDLGPEAGSLGGELVFAGTQKELMLAQNSLTADYITGRKEIELPSKRRTWKKSVTVHGATENNLKNIDVEFPLEVLTAVTGVSGSGKSTLVGKILHPALTKMLGGYGERTGAHLAVDGDVKSIDRVEFVDQNPIGKSSRSNPVTYIKAYDEIRSLYANLPMAKMRGYKPSHFSFNVDGGRCDVCKGEGTVTIEMQFMADIVLPCDNCHGKRFNEDVLELSLRDKSIADILDMTVDDAIAFFSEGESAQEQRVAKRLRPLQEVGLGYVHLGQSSNTLSGGEAQRIKLAFYLSKGHSEDSERILFIFDEPTTGLHVHDISKLLKSFDALLKLGHTIVVIEHNLDVIKSADHLIDLGPEGGEGGGSVIYEGVPEGIKSVDCHTARALEGRL